MSDVVKNFISRSTAKKVAYLGASTAVIFLVAFIADKFSGTVPDLLLSVLLLLSITLFMIAILIYAGAYLEVFGTDLPRSQRQADMQIESIQKQIEQIVKSISDIPEGKTEIEVTKLVKNVFEDSIKDNISKILNGNVGEIAESVLLSEYSPKIYLDKSYDYINNIAEKYIEGIHNQITIQQRNANFNVYCGMGFAFIGTFAMGIFVWQYQVHPLDSTSDWKPFIFGFIPKFTFVLIFESIAFFFLKAYRDDRSMVRYLRNQSTNMEAKTIGILASILFGMPTTIDSSIGTLMRTERNFVLKPKERTIIESLEKSDPFLLESIIERIVPSVLKNISNGKSEPP